MCQNPFKLQICSYQRDTILLRRVAWLTSWACEVLESVLVTTGRKEVICTFSLMYRSHPIEHTNKRAKMLGSLLLPCHHAPVKAEFSLVMLPQNLLEGVRSSRRDPISILGIEQHKWLQLLSFPPLSSSTDPSESSAQGWISPEESEASNMTTTLQPKILL